MAVCCVGYVCDAIVCFFQSLDVSVQLPFQVIGCPLPAHGSQEIVVLVRAVLEVPDQDVGNPVRDEGIRQGIGVVAKEMHIQTVVGSIRQNGLLRRICHIGFEIICNAVQQLHVLMIDLMVLLASCHKEFYPLVVVVDAEDAVVVAIVVLIYILIYTLLNLCQGTN